MKRLLLVLLFIVFVAQPCLGTINAFTTSVDDKQTYKNSYRWTGKHKDKILLWAKEVEDRLDGTTYNQSLFLQPTTAPTATEGRLYYDASANKIKFHNGTGWITIEAASGNALDDAYDAGEGITVDSGTAVTLTTSAASDSAALAIVHGETGNYAGMTLSNASAYPGVQFTTTGAGADITGTSTTWSLSKLGALTCLGFTTATTGDCLFDDTYDVAWDADRDTLIFQDNAILGIGGAHDAAPDFAIKHDGTDANVIPAAASAVWHWGNGTNDIDMYWYGSAAGDYFWWDESGAELLFVDAHIGLADDGTLTFGTNDDFVVSSAADGVLVIAPDAQGNEIRFGTTYADAVVLTWYSDSDGDTVVFDEDNIMVEFEDVKLALGDATPILFGDTIGAGTISMQASTNDLVIDGVVANTGSVQIGNDANGIDFHLYARTASDDLLWDASDERLEGVGVNLSWDDGYISLGDGDAILFGDALGTGDLTISSTSAVLSIDGTTPGTGSVYIGQDNLDILFKWFGETANSFFQFTGDQFQGDAVTIALGDGDAILFGDTLGTGHFSIAEASNVLITKAVTEDAGSLTYGVDANGMDVTWYGEDASAYMKYDATSASTLLLVGVDSSGTLLAITGVDTTGDSDTITIAHDGDGDAIQMTVAAPASVGINIIGDAAGTHPAINIDLETGAWVGAATTGAIEVTNDGLLVADASLLRLENKGKIAVANDGACLEIIDSGAATGTSYAARIASTSNEALHVDTGIVLIDETLTATLGVQFGLGADIDANDADDSFNLIPDDVSFVLVDAVVNGATDYVTLPNNPVAGTMVRIYADGVGFEVRTLESGNDTINTVDTSDGGTEYVMAAEDIAIFTAYETGAWSGVTQTTAGVRSGTVTPD